MRAKVLITGSNIMFLLAAVYFVAVAALGEGSAFTFIGTILCLIAVFVSLNTNMWFSGPWRVATAVFSIVLFIYQVGSDFVSNALYSASILASLLINGAFFLLFLGVLLSTSRDIMRKSTEEEDEEETKEAKKITFEI